MALPRIRFFLSEENLLYLSSKVLILKMLTAEFVYCCFRGRAKVPALAGAMYKGHRIKAYPVNS